MKKIVLVMLSVGTTFIVKAQTETFTLSNLNKRYNQYNLLLTLLVQDSILIQNEIDSLTNKRKELEIKQDEYKQVYGVSSNLIGLKIKEIGKHYEYDWTEEHLGWINTRNYGKIYTNIHSVINEGKIGDLHKRLSLIEYQMLLQRRDIIEIKNLIQISK
jgi:hypothetical protein